ncbi:MAG: hypothetical protein WKF84_07365 [Pyrinomonadaceae bacterium]
MQKQRVEGLLKLEYAEAVQRTQVRKYAGREGGWREEKQVRVSVEIEARSSADTRPRVWVSESMEQITQR